MADYSWLPCCTILAFILGAQYGNDPVLRHRLQAVWRAATSYPGVAPRSEERVASHHSFKVASQEAEVDKAAADNAHDPVNKEVVFTKVTAGDSDPKVSSQEAEADKAAADKAHAPANEEVAATVASLDAKAAGNAQTQDNYEWRAVSMAIMLLKSLGNLPGVIFDTFCPSLMTLNMLFAAVLGVALAAACFPSSEESFASFYKEWKQTKLKPFIRNIQNCCDFDEGTALTLGSAATDLITHPTFKNYILFKHATMKAQVAGKDCPYDFHFLGGLGYWVLVFPPLSEDDWKSVLSTRLTRKANDSPG